MMSFNVVVIAERMADSLAWLFDTIDMSAAARSQILANALEVHIDHRDKSTRRSYEHRRPLSRAVGCLRKAAAPTFARATLRFFIN